jgi:hypothetical protein
MFPSVNADRHRQDILKELGPNFASSNPTDSDALATEESSMASKDSLVTSTPKLAALRIFGRVLPASAKEKIGPSDGTNEGN